MQRVYPPVEMLQAGFSPSVLPGLSASSLVGDFSATGARALTSGTDSASVFPGSTSVYLSTSYSSTIQINTTYGWTIGFWNKCTASSGATMVVTNTLTAGGIQIDQTGGGRCLLYNSSGTLIGNVNCGLSAEVGTWTFLAFQVNAGATTVSARFNRLPWVTASTTGTPAPGSSLTLRVGYNYPGSMSGLFIAQASATYPVLTTAQIDSLMGNLGGVSYSGLSTSVQNAITEFWPLGSGTGNQTGSKAGIVLTSTGSFSSPVAGPYAPAPTSTGQSVTSWLSAATARNDLVNLTPASVSYPTYVAASDSTNALGRPCVRFSNVAGTIENAYPSDPFATKLFLQTATGSYPNQAVTIVKVGRSLLRAGAANTLMQVGTTTSGHYVGLGESYTSYGQATQPSGQVLQVFPNAISRYSDIYIAVSDTSHLSYYFNTLAAVQATVNSSNTPADIYVGAVTQSTNYWCAEDFERILVYSVALNSTQLTALKAGLRSLYPLPVISTTQHVVFWTGNSIHYGVGCSAAYNDIPTQAMINLGANDLHQWIDFSILGQSTAQAMNASTGDPSKLAPYNVPARLSIVSLTEITNDIWLYGATVATAYSDIKTYVTNVLTVMPNAKITITTCLPRGSIGGYSGSADYQSAIRNATNYTLRLAFPTATAYPYVFLPNSSAPDYATFQNCVLADWAANPFMGSDLAETTTNFAWSGIHPTNAGALILSAISANAIRIAGF
jgi:hypothetical protein